ncbi:MAG: HEAT repeat domain-containing protein [Isosphaerales bacterium]
MRRHWCLCTALLACLSVASASHAGASEPGHRGESKAPDFRAPPGFVVEKVAGPPLVRYPLFAAFDEQGRLYVAEGTGTNLPGAELREKKLGRVLRLEDVDGDGKFDTSTVFADGLVFPQGVLWHDGALYVASHPSIWRLEDPDGKGVATSRVELVSGFGFNGNGCDIHGPFLGPDGRLYWTDGRHGYKVQTRDGEVLEGLAARIWRCRTDGTQVERLCGGGFDNPVELDFTPDGEAIGTMDQGPGDCLLHYVEGGVYPMDHPCLKEFAITGPPLGAVRQYSSVLPAALCGFTRYRSRGLGPEFQDRFLSTQYMLHKIVRHELVRDGSTFRAEDADFVTCTTHDVRLTDVLEDADGSVLFLDMGAWFTYGFPGNPLPKPEALGAIYRVRRIGAERIADPRGLALGIEKRSPSEAIALLDDPRPLVRVRAANRLARVGAPAVPALAQVLKTPRAHSGPVRRDAVWALCRIEVPAAREAIHLALADPDSSVRVAAAHAAGLWRDAVASAALAGLVVSDIPPVRRKAAEALGRIGRREAVPALLAGLRAGGDRFLEHALIYALIRINDRASTLAALDDPAPRVRRAGLFALDQMTDGRLTEAMMAPLLRSSDAGLQRAALEVVCRRPAWSFLVRDLLTSWLSSPALSPALERLLADALPALGGEPGVREVVAEALAAPGTPEPTRLLLIRAVGQCRLDALPERWLAALGVALAGPHAAVVREAVATIRARKLSGFDRALVELSRKPGLPADLRIAALESVAARAGPPDPRAFDLLVGHLTEGAEPLTRLAAARTLGAGPLTAEQSIRLAGSLEGVNPMVLRLLLPAFAGSSDVTVGTALVEALASCPSAATLGVAELDRALKVYPPAVRERARGLRAALVTREKGKTAYLARLSAELDQLRGDPDAGQEVFLATKVGCFGCHRAVGRGGTVGPDLSRIGKIRSRAELLESIIFPGLTVTPEYRTVLAATRDGRVTTGLVVRDTPEAVYLRTTELSEIRIPRKDLEEMTPSPGSLMPEGLETIMTRQELRDLLEFLARQG